MGYSFPGASLAQDRGRLEARIDVLSAELEAQRKQNEKDNDTLRIKAKIMDDQTETIRRLKEVGWEFVLLKPEGSNSKLNNNKTKLLSFNRHCCAL